MGAVPRAPLRCLACDSSRWRRVIIPDTRPLSRGVASRRADECSNEVCAMEDFSGVKNDGREGTRGEGGVAAAEGEACYARQYVQCYRGNVRAFQRRRKCARTCPGLRSARCPRGSSSTRPRTNLSKRGAWRDTWRRAPREVVGRDNSGLLIVMRADPA